MGESVDRSRRPGRPKGSNGEATRQMIIDTAHACLVELGFERTTLALVAERAKLTRSAVYNYFDSKEALAEAALLSTSGHTYRSFLDAFWWRVELPEGLSTLGKLRFLVERSVNEANAADVDPELYLRILRSSEAGSQVRKIQSSVVRDQRSVLSRILVEGIAGGELSVDLDFEATLDALQGIIWSITIGVMSAPNSSTRRQAVLGAELVLRDRLVVRAEP